MLENRFFLFRKGRAFREVGRIVSFAHVAGVFLVLMQILVLDSALDTYWFFVTINGCVAVSLRVKIMHYWFLSYVFFAVYFMCSMYLWLITRVLGTRVLPCTNVSR